MYDEPLTILIRGSLERSFSGLFFYDASFRININLLLLTFCRAEV